MDQPPDLLSRPIDFHQEHRLFFTRDVFAPDNLTLLRALLPEVAADVPAAEASAPSNDPPPGRRRPPVRVLVFWDSGLEAVFPGLAGAIEAWFAAHREQVRLTGAPVALPGGEAVKNDFRQLGHVWSAIEAAKLCRHSRVMAVGGGSILDLVGFGASTAHRGIPLVRLPTTSLSQGDGGVGVKNGVNFFQKKNWLGAFGVPLAVVSDADFLHRLPPAQRRAGLIEAVKVALIRDAAFFEFIAARVDVLAAFAPEPFEAVIRESARQHVEHIATSGDPFERGSARPLDFGHWAAHKLEQMSGFRLAHGEAVAIGMALDLIYARHAGLLAPATAERILGVIAGLGFTLYSPVLEQRGSAGKRALPDGLEEFREHMGGQLTIPMIRAPGDRLDVHRLDPVLIERAIDELKTRYG